VPESSLETSSNAPFPTTRWSQLVAVGDRAGPAVRDALAELCSAYWYPLYATEGAVRLAASRLRKRYGEILREEIARTVANPADVEDEVRAFFAALAR
jgi:hypothetical protein